MFKTLIHVVRAPVRTEFGVSGDMVLLVVSRKAMYCTRISHQNGDVLFGDPAVLQCRTMTPERFRTRQGFRLRIWLLQRRVGTADIALHKGGRVYDTVVQPWHQDNDTV